MEFYISFFFSILTDEGDSTDPSQNQNVSQLNVSVADGNNVFADRVV
jgi:hypothetical protein